MPVIFKTIAKGYTPSNKYGVTKDTHEWAYTYTMPDIGTVRVRVPVIDKISLTIPVTDDKLELEILHALKKVETGTSNKHCKKAWGEARKDYWIAINCNLTNDETMLIQANLKKEGGHLIRIEFNPAKQWKWGLGIVQNRFEQAVWGLIDWPYVVKYARATRVDVAVDIVNATMADLVVTSHVPGKNHLYVAENGDLETAYVGMPAYKKPTEQLVYNKVQHAEDMGTAPLYNGIVHTRVEMIVKSSNQKFANIANITNPLGRVTVSHPAKEIEGIDPVTWRLFLETCRYRGPQGTLSLLPNELAKTLSSELNAGSKRCWRPEKLWAYWPNAVKKSGLLNPDQMS